MYNIRRLHDAISTKDELNLYDNGMSTSEMLANYHTSTPAKCRQVTPTTSPVSAQICSPYSLMTTTERDAVKDHDLNLILNRIASMQSIQSFGDLNLFRGGTSRGHCNNAADMQNSNWELRNNNDTQQQWGPPSSNLLNSLFLNNNNNNSNGNVNLSAAMSSMPSDCNKRFSLGITLDDILKISGDDNFPLSSPKNIAPEEKRTNSLHYDINSCHSNLTTNSFSYVGRRSSSSSIQPGSFNPTSTSESTTISTVANSNDDGDDYAGDKDDTAINPLDSKSPYFNPTFAEEYRGKLRYLVDLMEQTSETRKGFEEAKRIIALTQGRGGEELFTIVEEEAGAKSNKRRGKKKSKKQVSVQRRRSSTVSRKHSLWNDSLGASYAAQAMRRSLRNDSLGFGAHRRSLSLSHYTPEIFGW